MAKKQDSKPQIELNEHERALPGVAAMVAEGFKPTARRKYPVMAPMTDEQFVELGEQAATLDGELKVIRQGKNATAAALQREKKEKEGAMHQLSAQIVTKKDPTGRALSLSERATYTKQLAAQRKAFDEWEEQRKETLAGLKSQVDAAEEEHAKLSTKIAEGKAPQHMTVLDLTDWTSGTVVTLRADTGDEVGRRALNEHERQLVMWSELSTATALNEHELGLAVRGRQADAVRNYAKRCALPEDVARRLVEAFMAKDDELPDEDDLPPEPEGAEA